MTPRSLERLKRMDAAEISWRMRAAARIAAGRARVRVAPPRWSRTELLSALAASEDLAPVRKALAARRWTDAHGELAQHFAAAPQRFAIAPSVRPSLVQRIAREFPAAAQHAAARADRILAGDYDLLGYTGLRFAPRQAAGAARPDIDWHLDPLAGRRAPRVFWADVPYLNPACGDHKVIWELNRHQHWIALGRAYWLTGDTKYRDRVVTELASWLEANPPLVGVNWASMLELAFRSMSWLWAINLFVDRPAEAGRRDDEAPWLVDLLVGLDRQLDHVERNLSYYFSPNTHLLGEALALYVCGLALPQLAASGRRAAVGRRILLAEIDRQIAPDGGHAERSTHYHRYTLDFYGLALVTARLTGDEARDEFEDAVSRLASAARLLADDRGRVPHIGDDDGGALLPMTGRAPDDLRDSLAIAAALVGRHDLQIDATPEEALWMLSGLPDASVELEDPRLEPPRSSALPSTGYYVSRTHAGDHLVIDGGPHGYQNAGHAHADALSLTFSVRGLALLIDPGTACYTIDTALRDRMRSTALHNTVTIDERSQSLPRGPFHWEHVATTRVLAWRANDAFDYFDAMHDGYAPVEHRRRVFALHGDLVVVADLVGGAGSHTASAHWHLDPGWTVDAQGRRVILTRGGERVGFFVPAGEIECISADRPTGLGWYSPAYGALQPTTTLRVSHRGAAPFWLIAVFDLNPQNAVVDVEPMPVWAEAGAMAHGTAIRIARAASVDYLLFAEPADTRVVPADAANPAGIPVSRMSAAGAAGRERSWRMGEIETDARMLFVRARDHRPIARVAVVDGSFVRTPGRRGFSLALPRVASDLHLDFVADARVAGAAFGARLVVGGEEQPIELDRRSEPRRDQS